MELWCSCVDTHACVWTVACSCATCLLRTIISLPVGGAVGLVGTIVGNSYVSAGIHELNDAVAKLGGNLDRIHDGAVYFFVAIAIVCVVVCLYGLRQKMRINVRVVRVCLARSVCRAFSYRTCTPFSWYLSYCVLPTPHTRSLPPYFTSPKPARPALPPRPWVVRPSVLLR